MNRTLYAIFFLVFPFAAAAQLPSSDVWLFSYVIQHEQYAFTGGQNVSNREGYDNQPSFSSNGTYMLWTSQRDSNETDIFRYDLQQRTTMRLTQTAYSEYSPTYMDGNKYISAVVVEKDSVQRLWRYSKMNGDSKPLLPKVFGVGYHCWFDARTVFIFQVTNPPTLVLVDARSGAAKICASNVGRCMGIYRSPSRRLLLYTQENDSSGLWIKALDSKGMKAAEFAPVKALEGSQDFAVDNRGNILMASGPKLYMWTIGKSQNWAEIADFTGHGLHKITRISISPDGSHIALVDNTD